jgi:hypothetical protein
MGLLSRLRVAGWQRWRPVPTWEQRQGKHRAHATRGGTDGPWVKGERFPRTPVGWPAAARAALASGSACLAFGQKTHAASHS